MSSSSFDSTDLPVLSPRTQCVLIPRDPHFIFAYWDYTEKDINLLRHDDPQFILRIHDLTHNHTWDIDVGFSAKNSYIHVGQDNADYYVEIGIKSRENQFVALAQSNTVHTPPKTASKRDDLIWQDIKFHRESRPYVREDAEARKDARKRAMQRQRTYELTGQDIDAYYTNLFASQGGQGAPTLEQILRGRWSGLSLEKVRSLIRTPDLLRKIHPGASGQFSDQEGGEGPDAREKGIGASELLHLSSQPGAGTGGSEERLRKRKFFFEVWTELIVHGRTEPDAVVWLNSKGVKLNPDGTFSIRYSLPDGEIPLTFVAQSSDSVEQRHVYTRVERAKTIGFPKMLKEFTGG